MLIILFRSLYNLKGTVSKVFRYNFWPHSPPGPLKKYKMVLHFFPFREHIVRKKLQSLRNRVVDDYADTVSSGKPFKPQFSNVNIIAVDYKCNYSTNPKTLDSLIVP